MLCTRKCLVAWLFLSVVLFIPFSAQANHSLSAWVCYWDWDRGIREAEMHAKDLENIIHFAVYFDEYDRLFFPDALDPSMPTLDKDIRTFLSYVNDVEYADGKTITKDTALLSRLLATPESRLNHAKEILELAREYGYDGIEIDYEAMGNNLPLWHLFANFVEILHREAEGMAVRILLEPGAPVKDIALPVGPDYVIMCYNLHGPHNDPGPKANDAFLADMEILAQFIPGNTGYALSTGGFDWFNGRVEALTFTEADVLFRERDALPVRDEASGCLSFSYIDDSGLPHTVWYADQQTLKRWSTQLQKNGIASISLWRLGGNIAFASP